MKRKILNFTAAALVLLTVLFACSRDIVNISVASVALNETVATLDIEKTINLVATVAPDDATDPAVTWTSSNNAVATVSQDAATPSHATVTAKTPGTAVITVTTVDGGKTASCTVTVNSPVTGITLNKPELILDKQGKSEKLVVIFTPDNASNKTVEWTSSNTTIATVNSDGLVTAAGTYGTAIITVKTTDGTNKTATCTVKVGALATAVTLNKTTLELLKNQSEVLIATVWPENASFKEVTWKSSDSYKVSVSSTGTVRGIAATDPDNPVIITVTATNGTTDTSDDVSATCAVSVVVPATNLVFDKDTMIMRVGGGTRQLTPIPTPSDATIGYNWTSSNTAVATVTQTGIVTAVSPGKATIVAAATVGGKVATCEVTVVPNTVPITGISLPATLTINGSDKGTLTATLSPDNTTDVNVTWSSSDENIATISGGGLTIDVNPVAPTAAPVAPATGDRTVTITVTSTANATKTASCTVTIKYVATTGVTITPSPLEFASLEANSQRLTATVSPANASIKKVTWKVDPAATAGIVAVNSQTGEVIPQIVGSTKVMATTADDITATCDVKVN